MKVLQEIMKKYDLSQREVASYLDVDNRLISKIKKGEAKLSELHLKYLDDLKAFKEMDQPLELKFDYVRIRFETTDVRKIIDEVLLLDLDWITPEDHGWYGYKKHLAFGDIVIMYDIEDKKLGVLLELKGGGCRNFEQILAEQNRSWYDFFTLTLEYGGIMKRLDLAIDDKSGILDIPFFIEKMKKSECDTIFKRFNIYSDSENKKWEDDDKQMGSTLYIGSRKSTIYFCLYEKDYEQYTKTGVAPRYHRVRNRFEIRLKDERAGVAIKKYVENDDMEALVFGIIVRYMCFHDLKKGKDLSESPVNKRWEMFIVAAQSAMRLTTDPEEISLEDTWRWIEKQVAPTLKMLKYIDHRRLADTVEDATLSTKQKNILKSYDKELAEVVR